MEIIFLGTGGGRINLIQQLRATGGFRINSESANIHVDPGPGALLHSLRLKQDPLKLDAVVVTHYHVDHVNDAQLLIEAMADYTRKRGRGILIGSKHTLEGDETGDRGITLYHQKMVQELHTAKPGAQKEFTTKKGTFKMEFVKAQHDESTTFGFKLFLDGKTIGYTSDTEYYAGIGDAYKNCDYLIVHCLKPAQDQYHGHMTTEGATKLIQAAQPQLAILSHFGMKMIPVADREAKKIEKETGVKTIAARDGMKLSL
ncbi:MAG TPA: MBL fold metallo-hydrolase [Candidatus Bilamarchaeaceae archaeon]|nr:MBL fold metallo-hydrolase [Candidatus Bilamarchaeaceae archaeon]